MFAEGRVARLVRRREARFASRPRSAVGAIEAHQVIDAVAVVQIGAAAGALAEPAEILCRQNLPVVERHSPVLPGRAERVRRRADGHVEIELMLARDIGAVAVDHERRS
jgi:hypothetical protein